MEKYLHDPNDAADFMFEVKGCFVEIGVRIKKEWDEKALKLRKEWRGC